MQSKDGTETLVIDCSITMAWYFKDEATAYTNAVRASLATERAVVPTLWSLEVANVLLMAERRKRSNQTRAAKWLRYLSALPIAVDPETPSRASTTGIATTRPTSTSRCSRRTRTTSCSRTTRARACSKRSRTRSTRTAAR